MPWYPVWAPNWSRGSAPPVRVPCAAYSINGRDGASLVNARKHIVLAVSAAILGGGLTLATTSGATASDSHSSSAATTVQHRSSRQAQTSPASRCC